MCLRMAELWNTAVKFLGIRRRTQALVRQNLLFNHDTLPLGEFAIGTNTTAYVMAEKYAITQRLPILIVEKWALISLWAIRATQK